MTRVLIHIGHAPIPSGSDHLLESEPRQRRLDAPALQQIAR
jgi:hypothetical protein